MSSARERVQQEAEDAKERANFPVGTFDEELMYGDGYYEGFIAGRTVTAEQIEQAARAAYEHQSGMNWESADDYHRDAERLLQRISFAAAGFIVEGADDD